MSNPDLVKHGHATQFGQPAGPEPSQARQAGNKPWSIRNAVRRLAAAEIDITRPLTPAMVAEMFGSPDGRVTAAQAVAITRMVKAIKGDPRFSQMVTEDVDGRLIESRLIESRAEAQVTLADLVCRSYEMKDL